MSLSDEQLEMLNSCPALKALKPWIISMDQGTAPQQNEENEEPAPATETYYFKSYNDDQGTELWATGTVETTGVRNNGYTEVEVLTNGADTSFVGQKFYVASDAEANGTTLYQLYSDAGTTGTGIYVKISRTEF